MRRSEIEGGSLEAIGVLKRLYRDARALVEAERTERADGWPSGDGDPRSTDDTSSTERAALRNLSHPVATMFEKEFKAARGHLELAAAYADRLMKVKPDEEAVTEAVRANEHTCANPACQASVPEGVRGGRCAACRKHRERTGHERIPFKEQGRKKTGRFDHACARCDSLEVAS